MKDNEYLNDDEKKLGFLARKKLIAERKIKTGVVPENGNKKVYSFFNEDTRENEKEDVYLGDSGKVYKDRNDTWVEIRSPKRAADIKYYFEAIAEHGNKPYNNRKNSIEKDERKEDYKMNHEAPARLDSARLSDLTRNGIYPEDILNPMFTDNYTNGEDVDCSKLRAFNNNPSDKVTIYRAIPTNIDAEINSGDWITINKNYAQLHGESNLNGDFKILEKEVYAKDVYTDGNSLNEWGFEPNQKMDLMISEISKDTDFEDYLEMMSDVLANIDADIGIKNYLAEGEEEFGDYGRGEVFILELEDSSIMEIRKSSIAIYASQEDFKTMRTGAREHEYKSYMEFNDEIVSKNFRKSVSEFIYELNLKQAKDYTSNHAIQNDLQHI